MKGIFISSKEGRVTLTLTQTNQLKVNYNQIDQRRNIKPDKVVYSMNQVWQPTIDSKLNNPIY